MTSSLRDLKVYTTYPHTCSYLPDREATTLFIDPRQDIDQALYSRLSQLGFRRSGSHIYRPHCADCRACIPARIPVERFRPDRSQRRIWRRNQDLLVMHSQDIRDEEAYDLYYRYIEQRHADGDMFPPDREQYLSFLNDPWRVTRYLRFYDGEQLVAVAVVDELEDGLSAIYTFFEPEQERRGLGVFAILWQIQRARDLGLAHVYLGYWIENCQKMRYKDRYQPLELLVEGRWTASR
ncbi:MAG: arginyltransferase [Haliea sp.]|nr:arginyltransferase [Haliea sp.]